jgi:type IV secretion system protein TrbC
MIREVTTEMKSLSKAFKTLSHSKLLRYSTLTFAASMALADNVYAQGVGTSPWVNAVQVLEQSFTGPIATGLALVSIVVGGLVFAFGEGGAKRTLAGIIFGVGMAVGAVNFMAWLFPAS